MARVLAASCWSRARARRTDPRRSRDRRRRIRGVAARARGLDSRAQVRTTWTRLVTTTYLTGSDSALTPHTERPSRTARDGIRHRRVVEDDTRGGERHTPRARDGPARREGPPTRTGR